MAASRPWSARSRATPTSTSSPSSSRGGRRSAEAQDARDRATALLASAETAHANIGIAALRLLASMATALEDADLKARTSIAAALREPDEDALVIEADAAVRAIPALEERLGKRLPRARRAEALLACARARVADRAFAEAAALFERAVDLTDEPSRSGIERRASRGVGGGGSERGDRGARGARRCQRGGDAGSTCRSLDRDRGTTRVPRRQGGRGARPHRGLQARSRAARALERAGARRRGCGRRRGACRGARGHRHARRLPRPRRGVQETRAHARASCGPRGVRARLAARARPRPGRRGGRSRGRGFNRRAWPVRRARRSPCAPRRAAERAVREEGDAARGAPAPRRDPRAAPRARTGRMRRADAAPRGVAEQPRSPPVPRGSPRATGRSREGRPSLGEGGVARDRPGGSDELALRAGRAALAGGRHGDRARARVTDPAQRPGLQGGARAARRGGAATRRRRAARRCARRARGRASPSIRSRAATSSSRLRSPRRGPEIRGGRSSAPSAPRTPRRSARRRSSLPERSSTGCAARERRTRRDARSTSSGSSAKRSRAPTRPCKAFLLAEALDVVQGRGAGLRELEATRALIGDHPLIGLGLAERFAAMGQVVCRRRRVPHRGAGLAPRPPQERQRRSRTRPKPRFGPTASRTRRTSSISRRPTRTRAPRRRCSGRASSSAWHPPPLPSSRPSSRRAPIASSRSWRRRCVSRRRPRHARMPGSRWDGGGLELGDVIGGEPLLWEALADGLVEAGDSLAPLLSAAPDRARDVVRLRRQQVSLEPGDVGRLELLRAAALADEDRVYARAVEHVLRAFDPGAGPLAAASARDAAGAARHLRAAHAALARRGRRGARSSLGGRRRTSSRATPRSTRSRRSSGSCPGPTSAVAPPLRGRAAAARRAARPPLRDARLTAGAARVA